MSAEIERAGKGNLWKLAALRSYSQLSLDTWAVITAFLAALLIRAGVIKHIPW